MLSGVPNGRGKLEKNAKAPRITLRRHPLVTGQQEKNFTANTRAIYTEMKWKTIPIHLTRKKTSTRVEGLFLESSFTQFCFCFLVRLNELNKKVKLPAWGGKWACPCLRVCRTKRSEMANVGCSSHTLLQVTRRTTESTIHWNEEKPFVNKKSNQIINSKVKMMIYKKTLGNGGREG